MELIVFLYFSVNFSPISVQVTFSQNTGFVVIWCFLAVGMACPYYWL